MNLAVARLTSMHLQPVPSGDPRLAAVRAWGQDTVSFQALEPGVSWWFDDRGHGVAYADTGAAWVAAGAPFAPEAARAEVARAFGEVARSAGRRVSFCAVERPIEDASRFRALQLGEQPIFDPAQWTRTLSGARSLREQLRRARAKQVQVRALRADERIPACPMQALLERLTARWLGTRGRPPLQFLLRVELGLSPADRRLWVATRGDAVVGALAALPIPNGGGWFIEDVLRDPLAPNGTTDLLVDAAMRAFAEEECRRVTFGLVPLRGDVPGWLRSARKLGQRWYDFDGLSRHREKLQPAAWEPVFVQYEKTTTAVTALWDVLSAVCGGHPLRWALAPRRS